MPPKERRQQPPIDPTELAKSIATQLADGSYECANCLEAIRQEAATWHCVGCYRVFHMGCIKKWAQQEESGEGRSFRCPHCQAPQKPVSRYRCFCLKVQDPKYDPMLSCPHTCGGTCSRKRGDGCPHPCPNQCHPGPCPECPNMAPAKRCPCGRTSYTYRCGKSDPQTTCSNTCGKKLSCGTHFCTAPCHHGPCTPCAVVAPVLCACGKESKDLPCGSKSFSCANPCGKLQRCGHHSCDVVCHRGSCPPCDRDPQLVVTCPCGKSPLQVKRESCSDPIATCGAVCGRVLSCGRHYCEQTCHDSPCSACESKSQVHCPCRSSVAKMYCKDIPAFKCGKKCKTKLSCGKHECEVICCGFRNNTTCAQHQCAQPCRKKLPCGHTCMENCHRGACPACPNIIVTPLTCRCGVELIMPPLPCGTQPPPCRLPCLQTRPCGHPSGDHACHHGDCPPCSKPTTRMCAGGHKELGNILCSAEFATCTEVCGREVGCGHVCSRMCHGGLCVTDQKPCQQPCGKQLPCGHGCPTPCHQPTTNCGRCAAVVELTCECGVQNIKLPCGMYLKRLSEHRSGPNGDKPFQLTCNDDCLYESRLSVLKARAAKPADSLGKVIYSPRLWVAAKESLESVRSVEQRLLEFLRSRDPSVMLPPMQREKRALVHELAHYFHMQSESHDQEPNRTVYLTKTIRSAIPNPLLSDAVQKASNDPSIYIASVLRRPEDAQKRVIVFEGSKISTITVSHCLSFCAGDFVALEPADDQLLEPRRIKAIKKAGSGSVTGDAEELHTVYAVFLPHRVKAAYEVLRQRGCTSLFHLIGFPYPPKQFAWEPTRPEPVVALQARDSSATAASTHVDPHVEELFVVASSQKTDVNEAKPTPSWSNLFQQQQQKVNAKARKEQEAKHLDLSNRFGKLRQ